MLLPAFVTHRSPLSSTVSPQGELNSLGKSKILNDSVSILYLKICPLYPYTMTETQTAFSVSSNASEPVVIYTGSVPSNPSMGIGTSDIPSDVPFFNLSISAIHIEDENIPTK